MSVIKSYGLERDSGTLYEHYRAYRDGRSEVLAMCSQIYYSSYRESEKAMVRKVFNEIDRQNLYSGFTDQEKVNFWAARLYRQRRQIGEEGGDENDIFDEDFLTELRKSEPSIDSLLRDIIFELARMEQGDADDLIRLFEKKVGLRFL